MLIELDRQLLLALNFDGGKFLDALFYTISYNWTWIPFYAFILWLLYKRYGTRKMLIMFAVIALMVITADQVCNIFKYGLKKFRPSHEPALEGMVHTVYGYVGGLYGTVSAHAATCVSIAVFSAKKIRARWYNVMMVIWVVLVCYSRMYLGVHYPMDLILGIIDGVLFAYLALWVYGKIEKRYGNK